MRTLIVLLACLLGAGCRQDRPASASAPPGATTAAAADLASPSLACAGMEGCVSACNESPDACARRCAARLSPAARPLYDALQACVAPACATPGDGGGAAPCLQQPSSLGCKLCVMSRCAKAAAACVGH